MAQLSRLGSEVCGLSSSSVLAQEVHRTVGPLPKRKSTTIQVLRGLGLGQAQYDFSLHSTCEANFKFSPDSGGREIDFTSCWEKLQNHITKGCWYRTGITVAMFVYHQYTKSCPQLIKKQKLNFQPICKIVPGAIIKIMWFLFLFSFFLVRIWMFSLKIFLYVPMEGKLCSEIYRSYVCFFFLIYLKQYDFGAQAPEIMVQLLPFSVLVYWEPQIYNVPGKKRWSRDFFSFCKGMIWLGL